jgi:hypothetical protein
MDGAPGGNAHIAVEAPDQQLAQLARAPMRLVALQAEGLSGILCVRPVSSLADEALAEDDGELCLGLEPLARGSFPILSGVVEDEV